MIYDNGGGNDDDGPLAQRWVHRSQYSFVYSPRIIVAITNETIFYSKRTTLFKYLIFSNILNFIDKNELEFNYFLKRSFIWLSICGSVTAQYTRKWD